MRKNLLPVLSLLGLPFVVACSSKSVSYGDPTTPTGSQMQALMSMNDVGANVSTAVKGMSDANKSFGMYSLMGSLQGTAVNGAGASQGLTLAPSGIDATCTSGTPATGFTYTNCMDNNTTINGSVKVTPTSASYDLTVESKASGTTSDITLKGDVAYTAGRLTGDLDYKIHVDLGSLGGLAGLGGSAANTDIDTSASWDISYTEEPSCITDGTIEVKVDYAGTLKGAKYTFTGCKMVTVQNGT